MQETIFISLPKDELQSIIIDCVNSCLKYNKQPGPSSPQPFIKGIHELARFLKVSPARAQKLKNEGVFPYWQDGRTLLFDPDKVREAMSNYNKKGRR
jgi:hypothetical protein